VAALPGGTAAGAVEDDRPEIGRVWFHSALLAAGRLHEVIQTVDAAWRFCEAPALIPYFVDAARHRPEAPVPRLGLVRAWLAVGETDRAQAELAVLRRIHPDLAATLAAGRSS
jgi:hypothetical protein